MFTVRVILGAHTGAFYTQSGPPIPDLHGWVYRTQPLLGFQGWVFGLGTNTWMTKPSIPVLNFSSMNAWPSEDYLLLVTDFSLRRDGLSPAKHRLPHGTDCSCWRSRLRTDVTDLRTHLDPLFLVFVKDIGQSWPQDPCVDHRIQCGFIG